MTAAVATVEVRTDLWEPISLITDTRCRFPRTALLRKDSLLGISVQAQQIPPVAQDRSGQPVCPATNGLDKIPARVNNPPC